MFYFEDFSKIKNFLLALIILLLINQILFSLEKDNRYKDKFYFTEKITKLDQKLKHSQEFLKEKIHNFNNLKKIVNRCWKNPDFYL
jgi:hypothetical protein